MSFGNFTMAFSNGIPLFNGTTAAFGTNCCCPIPDGYLPIADCVYPYIPGTANFCDDASIGFYGTASYSGKAYAQILTGGFRVCRYVIPGNGTTCPSPNWPFASFVDVGAFDPIYENCASCECDCVNGESPSSLTVTFAGITPSTCCPLNGAAGSHEFEYLESSDFNPTVVLFPSTVHPSDFPLNQCYYSTRTSIKLRHSLHIGTTCQGFSGDWEYYLFAEALWAGTAVQVRLYHGTVYDPSQPTVYAFDSGLVSKGTNDCSVPFYGNNAVTDCSTFGFGGQPASGGSASVVANF